MIFVGELEHDKCRSFLGSVSTCEDWGMMVPAFIMIVPASMVPDNRVSPHVEDPPANEQSESKRKSLVLR